MRHKISASSLFQKRYLIIRAEGVKFYEANVLSRVRRFRFEEIECVLMSSDNHLSFQVGLEVFSIPVKRGNQKQHAAIAAFLEAMKRDGTPDTIGISRMNPDEEQAYNY